MKISIIDHIMWMMMAKRCYHVLKEERPEWKISEMKPLAKKRFLKILKETPSIGSYFKSPMRKNLNGGAIWFAIYEIAYEYYGNQMSEALYEKMINYSLSMPILLKNAAKTDFFSKDFIEKSEKEAKNINANTAEYNWKEEIIRGKSLDEITVIYTQCGLCKLAKRLHHENLLPFMCRTDYIMFNAMKVNLHRNKTLATGDDCCYYYCTRPGSEADDIWHKEHPDGTFQSK